MGWLSVISTAYSFLFGGGTTASGASTPGLGTQVVQAYLPESDTQKSADDAADLKSAREYQPLDLPAVIMQQGIVNMIVGNIIRLMNAAVDALNHSIRPGVLVWFIGGFSGAWKMPDANAIDPWWKSMFYLVMTFWFGGRMVIKDLPMALAAFSAAVKKK